jgi:hypothetical protein
LQAAFTAASAEAAFTAASAGAATDGNRGLKQQEVAAEFRRAFL